jgi:hypothetical protein
LDYSQFAEAWFCSLRRVSGFALHSCENPLFQDPAHGKIKPTTLFNICTGKKILQKLNIFAIGQILKQVQDCIV